MSDLQLLHYNAAQASNFFDRLVEINMEVHPEDDNVFNSEDRYRQQLSSHMAAPGFELVTASFGSETVGYVYGFPLPENARWWRGLLTRLPEEVTAETGRRTFALCEIMVRQQWQRRSIGHALHDEILAGRFEERATLLEPDEPAHGIYLKWGWQVIGKLRPSWEGAPTYDAMMLPLPLRR